MTRIVCPTATGARFFPRRAANRRYCADKYVSLVGLAAHAAWVNARRSQRSPLVVRPLLALPPLRLWPGQIPAHEDRWAAVGKTDMSVPNSATSTSAVPR